MTYRAKASVGVISLFGGYRGTPSPYGRHDSAWRNEAKAICSDGTLCVAARARDGSSKHLAELLGEEPSIDDVYIGGHHGAPAHFEEYGDFGR